MNNAVKVFLFLCLFCLSLLPALGAHYNFLPDIYARYFYLAELGLAGIFVVFLYAKHLSVFFIILLIAGFILSQSDNTVWQDLRVPVTFWGLYSLCWLLYFELGKSRPIQALLHTHWLVHLLFYLCFMAAGIAGSFALTVTLYDGWDLVPQIPDELYALILSMATVIPTLTIGVLKIIDYIGAHHVMHFFLGTYYRPVERTRVVLFLDMAGSTSIAEKLSPKGSMEFIASFIYDASKAFRMHGGDIINYTGDGLVVLWQPTRAENAIASVEHLTHILRENRALYQKKFGALPNFRIGIHCGPVVISQIGEEKLFIGLYGDTVNTAARLEQMCKEMGVKILLSKTVRQYLTGPLKDKAKPLGKRELRGREEKLEIYTIEGL
ncbi:MAG: adenylate/guanylate cyclase domain-containing protein [Alphaproteobacteria bacterium]|nr:adenylate/guanylate cyclase domain-containing protein [Alphaproteobacteria bacterium]